MKKIVLIGSGNVGIAYAYAMLLHSSKDICFSIIDIDEEKVEGQVEDLLHASYLLPQNMKIQVGSYQDCSEADIVCITAGVSQNGNKKSRMEDLKKANQIIKEIIQNVKKTGFSGIYLIASNPLDVMCYATYVYSNCPKEKVIGTGTLLDSIRLKSFLAREVNKSKYEVYGYVLGEHGKTAFPVWSKCYVHENSIQEILPVDQLDKIEQEMKEAGFKVCQKQGFTCYGVAMCLCEITNAILEDRQCVMPVCSYYEPEKLFISTPTLIGKEGVIKSGILDLSLAEKQKLQISISAIKEGIKELDLDKKVE